MALVVIVVLNKEQKEHLLKKPGLVFTVRLVRKKDIKKWFARARVLCGKEVIDNVVIEEVAEIKNPNELLFYLKYSGYKSLKEWREKIMSYYNVLKLVSDEKKFPPSLWVYKLIYYGDEEDESESRREAPN